MRYDILSESEHRELTIRDALTRLISAFNRIEIDRDRGLAVRNSWGANCGSYHAICENSKINAGAILEAAWVKVYGDKPHISPIEFVLENELDFFVKHKDEPDRISRSDLVRRIADVLGYEVDDWHIWIDAHIVPRQLRYINGIGIAQQFELVEAITKALDVYSDIYEIDVAFLDNAITASVEVNDIDIGKRCILEGIERILPQAEVRFEINHNSLPRCEMQA